MKKTKTVLIEKRVGNPREKSRAQLAQVETESARLRFAVRVFLNPSCDLDALATVDSRGLILCTLS